LRIISAKVPLRAALFAISLLPGVMRAAEGCKAGEILVAEDQKNYYCLETKSYKKSQGPKIATQYCGTKKKVAADQEAIRDLGFAVDVERYEMFGKVADDQRAELKRRIFTAMFDQGLAGTGKLLDSAKSLNPWNVNKAAQLLEEKGLGNAQLIAALRDVARVRGKPEMAEAYHHFEQLAKSAVEGYNTGRGMAQEPDTAKLQLLAGALKTMQGNYELGLVITGLEFGESIAYLSYVSGQVNDLAQETDDKLAKLAHLGERLRGDVNDLVHSRQSWQAETDIPIPPSCAR
jgi:hypothetical protein